MPRSREGYLWTKGGSVEGLETNAAITSSSDIKGFYDVIVIGAGFAGLTAAREISTQHNIKILIVEGRDRIGGRTWTATALGEEFEMGGTWVHWNQPHLYHQLHRYSLHHNLKTSAGTIAPSNMYFKSSQGTVTSVDMVAASTLLEDIATAFFNIDGHTSRTLMPYPHEPFRQPAFWKDYDNLSIRQRLDQLTQFSEADRDLFESNVASLGSAPGQEIGFVEILRWYALSGHSMTQFIELCGTYKIGKGGMTSLARKMLDEFSGDILMNSVVRGIEQDANEARIRLEDGRMVRAKAVISTIPLNCLSDIKFDPPLSPLRQQAIQKGHINKGAKVHFKLSETESAWFGTCSARSDLPFCFGFSDHNGTSSSQPNGTFCIGFGYNNYLADKRNSHEITQAFKKCFRPNADVAAYLTHDWFNDPLAKGVWACWGPGMMKTYLEELQKGHGRVVFASADWADGWRGFVDGAIERGNKAASEALYIAIGNNKSGLPHARL